MRAAARVASQRRRKSDYLHLAGHVMIDFTSCFIATPCFWGLKADNKLWFSFDLWGFFILGKKDTT